MPGITKLKRVSCAGTVTADAFTRLLTDVSGTSNDMGGIGVSVVPGKQPVIPSKNIGIKKLAKIVMAKDPLINLKNVVGLRLCAVGVVQKK